MEVAGDYTREIDWTWVAKGILTHCKGGWTYLFWHWEADMRHEQIQIYKVNSSSRYNV